MKVLCSISARIGSKEIPKKNLREIGGKPLIAHSIETAKKSNLIDKIIVNTDSDEIAQVSRDFGAEVPFIRKKNLARDDVPLLMVTKNTMEEMIKQNYIPDIVIQLAPTCPFIKSDTIDETIRNAKRFDCSVSLKVVEHDHPYRAKLLNKDNIFKNFIDTIDVEKFQSRQDLPKLYCTSGGLYTRTTKLLKKATGLDFCFGPTPHGIVVSQIESINIDREIDFLFAEFIFDKNLHSAD